MTPESPVTAIDLEIDSRLENVSLLGSAVRGALATVLPDDQLFHWELCVVEAASNCVSHAYAGEAGHRVRVEVTIRPDRVEVRVVDSGRPAPVDRRAGGLPAFDANDLSTLAESGRGMFLIDSLVDSMTFDSAAGRNTLTLVKSRPTG